MKFQTPVTSLRRSYFNFDLQWSNPYSKYGNFFSKLSYSSESLFKPIDEKSYLLNFGTDIPEKNIGMTVMRAKDRVKRILVGWGYGSAM